MEAAELFAPAPETFVRQPEPIVFHMPEPVFVPAPEPTPILLTADLVADMLTPSPRPRLMGAAAKELPPMEAPAAAPAAKRGRPTKVKPPVATPEAAVPAAAKAGRKPKTVTPALETVPAAPASKTRKK
jgi:hypothetical protein